ncbi:lysophospholipid acyltransferase 1-like protein [Tanacetum coccineum]
MDASGGSGSNSPVWLIVGTMDNLEERIANLEMVFAYLKNKEMLERQENKPKKEFEVASKSTSSTSKPKKVTTHKVVTQKVQTKAFPVKSPVPIKNCILGLASAHTWACTGNKTFGTRKQKDSIVAGQARKGKKKDISSNNYGNNLKSDNISAMMSQTRSTRGRENSAQPHLVFTNDDVLTEILIRLPILCIHLFTTVSKQWLQILTSPYFTDRRRKIPIIDPPAGIFANHLTSLFECEFLSLDPRLESIKLVFDNSFTLGSNKKAYHVNILQSCNGLLLCSGWGSPAFYYVYNPSTNLFKRLPQPDNSHDFSILHAIGVLRMAFDPTKSRESETKDRQLTLYKFHIDDHGHTIITTLEIPNGLHQGSNFLQSFGGRECSYDPMCIQIDIHAILHLQRRLFESRRCLLLVSRDDIDSNEFTIYEMVKGYPVWTVSNNSGKNLKSDDISAMMSQTRSTRGRENSAQSYLVFTNDGLLTEILIQLPILCIHLFTTVSKQWLQILTSPHFTDRRKKIPILDPPAEGLNRELKHFKLNMEDHDHPIMTSLEIAHGLHRGKNFLESFGRPINDPILLLMELPHMLHLEGKIFESCGCLLLVCRDDIGSTEFTIYEMMKGSFVWSFRYLVNIVQSLNLLPDEWSIRTGAWSICLGEGEEDDFVVTKLSGKVVKYNLI